MDPAGRSALVSGGASGLGLAVTRRLAARGAEVIIADLPSSDGEDVARSLGRSAVFMPTDVTDIASVEAAVDRAVSSAPLGIVVNCAGIGAPQRIVERDGSPSPLDDFARTIEVNLVGTFNIMRIAVSRMIGQQRGMNPASTEDLGVIVNTASIAAFDGQIGQTAYSASKGGIVAMTLPAARELAIHRIRVVAVAPGMFDTPLLKRLPESVRSSLAEQVPHPRRLGDPDEFAHLVEHIIENSMINGETVRIDGAIRMAPR